MLAMIRCQCGWRLVAHSREQAVAAMKHHILSAHPSLVVVPTTRDLFSMVEELPGPTPD